MKKISKAYLTVSFFSFLDFILFYFLFYVFYLYFLFNFIFMFYLHGEMNFNQIKKTGIEFGFTKNPPNNINGRNIIGAKIMDIEKFLVKDATATAKTIFIFFDFFLNIFKHFFIFYFTTCTMSVQSNCNVENEKFSCVGLQSNHEVQNRRKQKS